jgi:hypothetical protein
MEKLSSLVAVTEIYDASIALGKMERHVISELEALQTRGKAVRDFLSFSFSFLLLINFLFCFVLIMIVF